MAESNFNLLEWYAAHRGEVAVLRDPSALFALGLLNHVGETPRGVFQQDLSVNAAELDQTIEKLYAAGFVTTRGTTLAVTPSGKQFLLEIGLTGPLPPPGPGNVPQKPEPPTRLPERPMGKSTGKAGPRTPFWVWGLFGILTIGVLIVVGVLVNNPGIAPTPRAPEIQTATRVVVAHTPVRAVSPTPTPFIIPGAEIVFEAEPRVVAAGDCATLAWRVDNAVEVLLEQEPVGMQGRRQVCPNETTAYTLTVISLTNEKHIQTIEVVVKRPETNYVWTIVGRNPPFDNLLLQSAMAHAVDEAAIVQAVLQGTGRLRNADPKLDELEYDMERARELVKQAEYGGQPVFIVPNADRTSVEIANHIAEYLAAVGFEVRPSNVPSRATILIGPKP